MSYAKRRFTVTSNEIDKDRVSCPTPLRHFKFLKLSELAENKTAQ